MAWALTIGCGLAVVALLVCEATGRGRGPAKITASACFVAVPLAGGADLASTYTLLIVAGLICGALGDVALLGDSRRALLRGLLLFLFGHLAYVAAFAPTADLALAPIAVGGVFVLVGAVLVAPRAGKLAVPVRLYSAVIGAMVATAVGQPGGWLIPVGAVLFALSDLAVARQRFVKKALINRALGLPAYYAGQLLIAWSAL